MEGVKKHDAGRSGTPAMIGREHQQMLLTWADRFGGWITTDLASHILRPIGEREPADRAAKALLQRTVKGGLLVARKLPATEYRAKYLYVLTTTGAALVNGRGGESIGRVDAADWSPPKTLNHDLRTARLLVTLWTHAQNIWTGAECQRRFAPTEKGVEVKIPDGLFRIPEPNGGPWTWLETEAQNKSGKSMVALGEALYLIAAGRPRRYELDRAPRGEAIEVAGAAVLLPPTNRLDHRPLHADHRTRVRRAINKARDKCGPLPGGRPVSIWVYTESESEPWLWRKERDIFTFGVSGSVRAQDEGWLRPPSPPTESKRQRDTSETLALSADPFAYAKAALADIAGEPARARGRLQRERDDARQEVKTLKAELDAANRKANRLEAHTHTAAAREQQAQERLTEAKREDKELRERISELERQLRDARQLIDQHNKN